MMDYSTLIWFGMTIGAIIYLEIAHRKERRTLNEMLAAKSYQEYKYYQGLYKEELKELKDLRDEARKERKDTFEEVDITEGKVESPLESHIAGYEEDWGEEVDKEKLQERIDENEK